MSQNFEGISFYFPQHPLLLMNKQINKNTKASDFILLYDIIFLSENLGSFLHSYLVLWSFLKYFPFIWFGFFRQLQYIIYVIIISGKCPIIITLVIISLPCLCCLCKTPIVKNPWLITCVFYFLSYSLTSSFFSFIYTRDPSTSLWDTNSHPCRLRSLQNVWSTFGREILGFAA